MRVSIKPIKVIALGVLFVAATPLGVLAANNSTLNQTINAGVLSTDILDGALDAVASPSVAMTAKPTSFVCQTGAEASTGTLGTSSERLYVTNPNGANAGWNLSIAASGGVTSTWSNAGATNLIDFNDPSTGGCSDGADSDAVSGQLTVDPAGTLTPDCQTCTNTGISTGGVAAFSQGTTDSVQLVNAGAGSDDVWRGYLTDVGLSQTIPAETPSDAYSLNLTLTATAQ